MKAQRMEEEKQQDQIAKDAAIARHAYLAELRAADKKKRARP